MDFPVRLDGFDAQIPFTRETWHGRMRACRGVAASLEDAQLQNFERDHVQMLEQIAPKQFNIPHFVEMLIFETGISDT